MGRGVVVGKGVSVGKRLAVGVGREVSVERRVGDASAACSVLCAEMVSATDVEICALISSALGPLGCALAGAQAPSKNNTIRLLMNKRKVGLNMEALLV